LDGTDAKAEVADSLVRERLAERLKEFRFAKGKLLGEGGTGHKDLELAAAHGRGAAVARHELACRLGPRGLQRRRALDSSEAAAGHQFRENRAKWLRAAKHGLAFLGCGRKGGDKVKR